MDTKVVDLAQFRAKANGETVLSLPRVYRLRGFYFEKGPEGKLSVPSDIAVPMAYTLSKTESGHIANPSWEPMEYMNPNIDEGWLVIRHHPSPDYLMGYLDHQVDILSEKTEHTTSVFENTEGLFSMTHREAIAGAPDHLIIYISKRTDDPYVFSEASLTDVDTYVICHPDGSKTTDPAILFPHLCDK